MREGPLSDREGMGGVRGPIDVVHLRREQNGVKRHDWNHS